MRHQLDSGVCDERDNHLSVTPKSTDRLQADHIITHSYTKLFDYSNHQKTFSGETATVVARAWDPAGHARPRPLAPQFDPVHTGGSCI
jgi:hypothetical protein